jgi:hypothetical protein
MANMIVGGGKALVENVCSTPVKNTTEIGAHERLARNVKVKEFVALSPASSKVR